MSEGGNEDGKESGNPGNSMQVIHYITTDCLKVVRKVVKKLVEVGAVRMNKGMANLPSPYSKDKSGRTARSKAAKASGASIRL